MSRIDTNIARAGYGLPVQGRCAITRATLYAVARLPDQIDISDTMQGGMRLIRVANRTRRVFTWGFDDGDGWFTITHSGNGMKALVNSASERLWL